VKTTRSSARLSNLVAAIVVKATESFRRQHLFLRCGMKLSQTETKPSTRSVLRFDEDEVIVAFKMLAKARGYKISQSGKCCIWHPNYDRGSKTSLVIDNDGSEFSIKG